MKLRFYHSTEHSPMEDSANHGLEDVSRLLGQAERVGASTENVDMSTIPEDDRFEYYSRHAVVPSFSNRYAIRQVFGTRRRGGTFFGRQIPALIVLANGDQSPIDVFPHQEGGNIVTIRDFLVSFLKDPTRYFRLRKIDAGSLDPEKIEKLVRIREEIFGDRVLTGDSAVVIRDARESR